MRRSSIAPFLVASSLILLGSLYAAPKEAKLPPTLGDKGLSARVKAEGPWLLILGR